MIKSITIGEKFLNSIIPLVSIFILMLGNGLYTTLASLRLKDAGETDLVIGAITSIYYLGMFCGSLHLSSLIIKIGHIRSFAVFAAFLAISTILPGMNENIGLWFVTRFAAGYSLAGLYITIESWLLNMASKSNRGKYMAFYMVALYGGQSGGQFFLNLTDYQSIMPFCIATILTIISIIPVAMIYSNAPVIQESQPLKFKELYNIAPVGIIGCVISGVLLASLYGLLPVYFKVIGYDIDKVALLVAITIFGGVVLQYPFGHLSDIMDRRLVIVLVGIIGIAMCVFIVMADHFFKGNIFFLSIISFVLGGSFFTIYPICMSHACDDIQPEHLVDATQGMLLAYGFGSIIGPIAVSYVLGVEGPYGLFMAFGAALLVFILFTGCGFIAAKVKHERAAELPGRSFALEPTTTPISSETRNSKKKVS